MWEIEREGGIKLSQPLFHWRMLPNVTKSIHYFLSYLESIREAKPKRDLFDLLEIAVSISFFKSTRQCLSKIKWKVVLDDNLHTSYAWKRLYYAWNEKIKQKVKTNKQTKKMITTGSLWSLFCSVKSDLWLNKQQLYREQLLSFHFFYFFVHQIISAFFKKFFFTHYCSFFELFLELSKPQWGNWNVTLTQQVTDS